MYGNKLPQRLGGEGRGSYWLGSNIWQQYFEKNFKQWQGVCVKAKNEIYGIYYIGTVACSENLDLLPLGFPDSTVAPIVQ